MEGRHRNGPRQDFLRNENEHANRPRDNQRAAYEDHKEERGEEVPEMFDCDRCHRIFLNFSELEQHYRQ